MHDVWGRPALSSVEGAQSQRTNLSQANQLALVDKINEVFFGLDAQGTRASVRSFPSSWPNFPISCLLSGICPMTNALLGCPELFCLPALSWVFMAIVWSGIALSHPPSAHEEAMAESWSDFPRSRGQCVTGSRLKARGPNSQCTALFSHPSGGVHPVCGPKFSCLLSHNP